MTDYRSLSLHLGMAVAIPLVISCLAGRLAPRNPSAAKSRPYECGVSEPLTTLTRMPVRFALVGMLFLVFDIEALFFYPWALAARELGATGLLAMGSFFVVMVTGYVYARGRNALEWR